MKSIASKLLSTLVLLFFTYGFGRFGPGAARLGLGQQGG